MSAGQRPYASNAERPGSLEVPRIDTATRGRIALSATNRVRTDFPELPTGTDSYASTASMASTRSGSSGVTVGAKRETTASSTTRNFSKFHRMSPV